MLSGALFPGSVLEPWWFGKTNLFEERLYGCFEYKVYISPHTHSLLPIDTVPHH